MGAEVETIIEEISNSLIILEKRIGLKNSEKRLEELNSLSENPDLWSQPEKARCLMRERQLLMDKVNTYKNLRNEFNDNAELHSLAIAENDTDLIIETENIFHNLRQEVGRREIEALLNGEADANDAFLDINAGAGGTESCDWAAMLTRMYTRWAEKQKYTVDLISFTPGEEAGTRSITLKITGINAYGWLKAESGVHRLVRISPFDSNARRHTSFSSVWVYPVIDDKIEVLVPNSDLRIDTYRSSGAGGQHVNTTDSAVRITHLPTGIVVTSSEKSQHQNRAICMAALKSRLYELELQKKTQNIQDAHENKGEAGWGNQIRSYVLQPYQLIKDLRTNYETSNSQRVLDGDITDFMSAALAMEASGKKRTELDK